MRQNSEAFCTEVHVDADESVVEEVVVPCPGAVAVAVVGVSPTATSRGAPSGTCCKMELVNF